jgi:TPR repeat protein
VSATAIPNPPTDVKRFHSPFAVEFDPSTVSKSVKANLRKNIELLGGIEKKHIPQIYEAALSSVLAGRDHRSLVAALVRIEGMPQERAWEITRNLHNKATEQINRERQSSLGITHAIWMYANAPCMKDPWCDCPTAADIRQDSAHRAANGKKYEIAKGLFVDGKWARPGVEEGCKCSARSVLPWTTPADAKPSAAMALWYRKCAEQGDAIAQYNLGLDSVTGRGVPQDYVLAYFWFDLAAAGRPLADLTKLAVEAREEAASHLSPADLSHVQEQARNWIEGHPPKLYVPEEE